MVEHFVQQMKFEFEMSLVEEFTYFLGLQVKKMEDSILYLKSRYCDADWVGSVDDRNNTSGGCFFLGNNFISWFSKKKDCVSLSTTAVETITTGKQLHPTTLDETNVEGVQC
ncbi:uncharacterized mitochondrial protein AtMg00810-like [Lathyrus oleraceus]|uniref:uncharacterized mitochondrial protein AtMg00810-like n=1 Tax=Pisum sativum TaxID=3888 RepID=UPI0021D17F89|nr:uncharacterized mitochondrial protein AtMg00810-like [Pisum sativum]